MRHPREMGEQEINAFLSHLATVGQVFTVTETKAVLQQLEGTEQLVEQMLYEGGLKSLLKNEPTSQFSTGISGFPAQKVGSAAIRAANCPISASLASLQDIG